MAAQPLRQAFKEWAVICRALAEGRQALILRKGGIAEPGPTFQPEHSHFWLYPTYGFEIHTLAGLLILAAIWGWTALDYFSPRRRISVSAGVLYWHFVDLIWLLVFTTYYVTPYLGFGR